MHLILIRLCLNDGIFQIELYVFRIAYISSMTPQPNFYTILRRIVYQIFQLLIRPTVPKSINRIILISQFTCQSGKFFHILQCTCTTIQPTPYRTSRPNPIRIYTFGKRFLSGVGARFVIKSVFTNSFKSSAITTVRHGVVIVPVMEAGFDKRRASSKL